MTDQKDTQTYANDSATSSPARTKPTQERSAFDPVDARRNLIAKRVAAGATTPIGHRCSNLVELLDNYGQSEGKQREHIEANIRWQMAGLNGLHQ